MKKKRILLTLFFTVITLCTLFAFVKDTSAQQVGIDDKAALLSGSTQPLEQEAQLLANQTKAGVFVVTTMDDTESPKKVSSQLFSTKSRAREQRYCLKINMSSGNFYLGNRKLEVLHYLFSD